jgi:hypothetical protein
MTLSVPQICQAKFPGQVEMLNITFRARDFDVVISSWNVTNTPRPTEAELLAEADEYQSAYDFIIFKQLGEVLVQETIDTTAHTRQYDNGVSCASYAQSTNPNWAAEAISFIAWRDSMFAYMLEVYSDIQAGLPIPTQDEFVAGFPEIVWP